ncbi:STAS/SEC14 domain-containing protein [Rhodoflexus sp.]
MVLIADLSACKIEFEPHTRTLIVTSRPVDFITDEEIKEITQYIAEQISFHRPMYYLADNRLRTYAYLPHMQKWVAETLGSVCVAARVKKFAVVQPEDLIVQLSNEQTAEELSGIPFQYRFFQDFESAQRWLNTP